MDPIVQQVLEGQHGLRMVRRIARGGFAEVFEAQSISSGIPCALKVSLDPIDDDNPAIAKELENLQYLKLLSGHPRIVVLMDVWTIGGYLVTRWELAPDEKARSLEDLLKHYQTEGHRGIPTEPLLRYMSEVAEGIDFLNGQGIYHRDIKPANLLLFWDHVKIGDLGLAKFVGASTGWHSGAGTMGYLPPEAYRGQLTPTVDLYSLAATYLKLRTGQEPFGRNPEEILERQKNADPILDDLGKAEAEVVRKALAPQPEDRPQQGAQTWCRQLAEAVQMAATPVQPAKPQQAPSWTPVGQSPKAVSLTAPEIPGGGASRQPDQPTTHSEAGAAAMPPVPSPGSMEEAITFGVSGAVAGGILGAIAGAIVGAVVWSLASRGVGPAGLGALGGGLLGALGGILLGKISGLRRSFLTILVTVGLGLMVGTFLGTVIAATLGIQNTMLSIALVTAVTGAVVWALVWAILGAWLGASYCPTTSEKHSS